MTRPVALVTGASSGIGMALARRIACDGRELALVARRAERLQALAAELADRHGVTAHVFPTDLLADGAAADLMARLAAADLHVDLLVNNAGVAATGRFDTLDVGAQVDLIRLDVELPVALAGHVLPGMVARGRGGLIMVASLGAFAPLPFAATYGAGKAFLLSWSEAVALELAGTGVHVLCVCPGLTHTDLIADAHIDVGWLPEPLWLTAEQVADETMRALGRDTVVVNGVLNDVAAHVLPRAVSARLAAAIFRARSA